MLSYTPISAFAHSPFSSLLNIHLLPWSLFHSDFNIYDVKGTQHLSVESVGMCKMYLLYHDSSSCMTLFFPSADFPYSYVVNFCTLSKPFNTFMLWEILTTS